MRPTIGLYSTRGRSTCAAPGNGRCRPTRPPLARVRRGFSRIRRTVGIPASAQKPTRPGPGRPKGSRNQQQAPRYTVGQQTKVDTSRAGTITP